MFVIACGTIASVIVETINAFPNATSVGTTIINVSTYFLARVLVNSNVIA
jgi:hypothetical protein